MGVDLDDTFVTLFKLDVEEIIDIIDNKLIHYIAVSKTAI